MKAVRSIAQKTCSIFRDLSQKRFAFPVLLFAICLLSFGLLISKLGFYWDDLPFIWMMNFLNPADIKAIDNHRPLTGWLYNMVFPVLQNSALRWQIFNLINRYLLGLVAWWCFSHVFKTYRRAVEWVAILLLLYPGFENQFIAVNTSRHILALALLLLSFGLTARAAGGRDRFHLKVISALVLSVVSMLMSDYFYLLELLRPLLLLRVQFTPGVHFRTRARRAFTAWLPYLVALISVVVWRLFFIEQLYYPVDIGRLSGKGGISAFFSTLLGDVVQVGFNAWVSALRVPALRELGKRIGLLTWMVIALVIFLSGAYFLPASSRAGQTTGQGSGRTSFARDLVLLGLLCMVLGWVPAWAANLPVRITGLQSRLTLPMMLGASFSLVGVSYFIRPPRIRILLLMILAGFAAGKAIQSAGEYRLDWERQKKFFWQLSWRLPGLEKGTVLLSNELPFDFETDNSLTPIVNWRFEGDQTKYQLDYMLYEIKLRLGGRLPALEKGHVIDTVYRIFRPGHEFTFFGNTSQALVLSYSFPSCLRVIQPAYDGHMTGLAPDVVEASDLSDPYLIQSDSQELAAGLLDIYGPEPDADWCYFYEKADLARQFGDWEGVYQLTEEALSLSTSPHHPSEYVLFIEALGRMGNYSQAADLTTRVLKRDPGLNRMLCDAWERIGAAGLPGATGHLQIEEARSLAGCK
jgi:hypothetical protein